MLTSSLPAMITISMTFKSTELMTGKGSKGFMGLYKQHVVWSILLPWE